MLQWQISIKNEIYGFSNIQWNHFIHWKFSWSLSLPQSVFFHLLKWSWHEFRKLWLIFDFSHPNLYKKAYSFAHAMILLVIANSISAQNRVPEPRFIISIYLYTIVLPWRSVSTDQAQGFRFSSSHHGSVRKMRRRKSHVDRVLMGHTRCHFRTDYDGATVCAARLSLQDGTGGFRASGGRTSVSTSCWWRWGGRSSFGARRTKFRWHLCVNLLKTQLRVGKMNWNGKVMT